LLLLKTGGRVVTHTQPIAQLAAVGTLIVALVGSTPSAGAEARFKKKEPPSATSNTPTNIPVRNRR
jgi:hypothetical protein